MFIFFLFFPALLKCNTCVSNSKDDDAVADKQSNSKVLLHLEGEALSLESKLGSQSLNLKPEISSVRQSQVLTKVKNFLGVFMESTRKVEVEAKKNPEKYDIESLTGEESEYIEMDLMLGVTELHTQEAVSAAESAIASYQPVIDLDETESEDCSDDDDDGDSSKESPKRKRANIVELS